MSKYELHTSLYSPHQEDGVKWMNQMENQLNGPKGGFLCDEMGLGKTVQIIATILKNQKNIPSSSFQKRSFRNGKVR